MFSFQNCFDFWAKIFQTFGQLFKKLSKLPSACPEEQFVAWKIFKKFWINLDFLQKPLAWFSNFYLRVQSKNCGRNSFLIFLFRTFSDFERKIFQTFGQKTSEKLSKLPSACLEEQFVASKFFKKFWTVLDFLQKPLAWFSSFYIRVQSKICGRKVFLIPPFWNFPDFERKIFQTFGRKTSRICQNYLLRVQKNNLWLEFFLSSESFSIFCRNHWHGSKNYIYESRLKIAEKTVFLCFLFRIVSIFERKFFRLLAKYSKSCQNYRLRVQRNNLWLEKFFKSFESIWIFCRNIWHGSQISIYVSRVKSAEETVFWFFFSEFFSDFEQKIFQTFGQKTSKSCRNYLLRVQRNSLWLDFFFSKVLNRYGFSAETIGMVLKFLSTCPE